MQSANVTDPPRRGARVQLFAVPFDSGVREARMGRGPRALLDAGLAGSLRDAGATVTTSFVEPPSGTFPSEIAVAAALQRELSTRVANARRYGELPVVLAGNCNSAVGTVAGMMANGEAAPAVLWFDAHADLNTPETTASGFLDGMALATLTGRCWHALAHSVPGFRPLATSRVALVGTRDVDPPEAEVIRESRIATVSAARFDDELQPAIEALAGEASEAYVHVDLDVLDPSEGRANGYAVAGGLSVAALRSALRRIGRRLRVGAVAFTAYDPACDPEGRIASAVVALAPLLVGDDGSSDDA